MDVKYKAIYEHLYDKAQPIIKYEAAKHLGIATDELRRDMIESEKVQYWIECAFSFIETPQIHGSFDTCVENWMNVLVSFGVNESDDDRLRKVNQAVLRYMIENKDNLVFYDTINPTICASYLAYMGYQDDIIIDVLRERVEVVYEFVQFNNYDIYVDKKDYPTVPKSRDKHPLVNPKLYRDNVWRLPTVHDVFTYINLPKALNEDSEIKEKIENIIDYIIKDEYQRLRYGYGLMLVQPRPYYHMGWSVHLDHYFDHSYRKSVDNVVWAMEIMSHFKKARESEWFKNSLSHLEGFYKDSIYHFPASYICEIKNKYYVGGGHMGLGENRRGKQGKVLESTAWMMRILKNTN